jgi:hypothetical protein
VVGELDFEDAVLAAQIGGFGHDAALLGARTATGGAGRCGKRGFAESEKEKDRSCEEKAMHER